MRKTIALSLLTLSSIVSMAASLKPDTRIIYGDGFRRIPVSVVREQEDCIVYMTKELVMDKNITINEYKAKFNYDGNGETNNPDNINYEGLYLVYWDGAEYEVVYYVDSYTGYDHKVNEVFIPVINK